MRPREFPAEAFRRKVDGELTKVASMRPREFPAEAARQPDDDDTGERASMRPREFPAEASGGTVDAGSTPWRFNEAAGVPRGSRLPHGLAAGLQLGLQ